MHVPPLPAVALPDARFGVTDGGRESLCPQSLDVPNVGDDRSISKHADVRCADRRMMRTADAAEIEIEFVERETFNDDAVSLGFDRGEARVAQLLIGRPIAAGDAVEQSVSEFEEFVGRGVGHG